MKRLMLRMAALFDEVFRRLVFGSDLDQLSHRVGRIVLAEVDAKPTLSIVHLNHADSFPDDRPRMC